MNRKRQGMTLIEIMVASAILTVITTLVYAGFAQTLRTRERTEAEWNRYHEITATLERLSRDLQMAYVSAQLNPAVQLQVIRTCFIGLDRGSGDRIDFTAFSHRRLYRDAHESDQTELSYFLTTDPHDSSKKVLARRESRRVDDDPQKGGEVFVALHDVLEFNVTYLDPLTWEWSTTWDTMQAVGQPNRLPAQVRVIIKVPDVRDPRKTLSLGTRATLPIRNGLNFAMYNP